jgi:hypothetical protein
MRAPNVLQPDMERREQIARAAVNFLVDTMDRGNQYLAYGTLFGNRSGFGSPEYFERDIQEGISIVGRIIAETGASNAEWEDGGKPCRGLVRGVHYTFEPSGCNINFVVSPASRTPTDHGHVTLVRLKQLTSVSGILLKPAA